MVSFRKLFMVMALLVIVTGIAMAATSVLQPVVTCSTYNQQTARLRQESQTELTPALTFACVTYNQLANQGSPVTAGTLYDWEVFFPVDAPLTSSTAIIGGETEPQLESVVYSVVGGTQSGSPEGGSDLFFYAKSPTPGGIYPGTATSGGSVIFPMVNMNPNNDNGVPGTLTGPASLGGNNAWDVVYVTITGLRVSALGLASNPPNYGGPLTLVVWAKPSQTKNGANQSNPGNVFLPLVNGIQQPTLAIGLGYAAPSLSVTESGAFDWRQCFAWSQPGVEYYQYFYVDFTELYSYAFSPPTDFSQTLRDQGWENPTIGGGNRLSWVFSSGGDNAWPSYVTLQVPYAIEVFDGTSVVVEAVLVTGPNADGSGGTVTTPPAQDTFELVSDLSGYNANTEAYYSPSDTTEWYTLPAGTTNVVYEILPGATDAVTTTLIAPVQGYIYSTSAPTLYPPPDDPSAQVTITMAGYAPWTPAPVPQITPIPRFVVPPPFQGNNLLMIDPCTTNLLYPYIVAGMGWDTGLTVANSGLDPFGFFYDGLAKPTFKPAVPGESGNGNDQPGICNVYFYGSFDRGAPQVTDATNPPNPIVLGAAGFGSGNATGDDPQDYIQPGTTAEDLVMAVLALNNPTVDFTKHSWNGYAIAQCDFLYAHGYAFTVFHGTLAQGGNLSLGYLALVFDQRGIAHPSQIPEKMTF